MLEATVKMKFKPVSVPNFILIDEEFAKKNGLPSDFKISVVDAPEELITAMINQFGEDLKKKRSAPSVTFRDRGV